MGGTSERLKPRNVFIPAVDVDTDSLWDAVEMEKSGPVPEGWTVETLVQVCVSETSGKEWSRANGIWLPGRISKIKEGSGQITVEYKREGNKYYIKLDRDTDRIVLR